MFTAKKWTVTDTSDPLDQLIQDISRLPKEYQGPLLVRAGQLRDVQDRRKRILNIVQEALSQLKLDTKYLLFDLECTRRERDEARK